MESRGFEGPLYTVIMGVLILGVVVAQAQVEPMTCCKDTRGTNCIAGSRRPHNCRCKFVSAGTKCPRDYPVMGTPQSSDVGEKAHTHVKGYNVNCPATEAKLCFDKCRLTPELCAEKCVCTLTPPDRNINCPTTEARMCYDVCRLPRELCLKKCGCTLSLGDISHYCKLGCASSVCNTMTTPHNTDVGAKGAVEHCNNACSEFCTKGANIAMVTA